MSPSPRPLKRLGLALAVGLLVFLLAVAFFTRPTFQNSSGPRHGGSTTGVTFPASALPLQMGIHVRNIYNLDLESQTFSADGWYWLVWDQRLNNLIETENLSINQLVEFTNQVETWNSKIEPDAANAKKDPEGRYSQIFRFSARFYIDSLDLHDSPFEKIELPLVTKTRPDVFSLDRQAVRLELAPNLMPLIGDYGDLAGYSLKSADLNEGMNTFESHGTTNHRVFSQLVLRVVYGSNVMAAFIKWGLPLLIVMIIVLLAPSLEGSLGEIRLAIPSTAILSLVFLQQTYRAELPATPYPTFLDQLYAYSYVVAVGLFVLFVWSSNLFESTPSDQQDQVRRQINRIDALCQRAACVGLGIWAVLAWLL
ncbi:MAG: hypothetical protein VKN83_09440 [Cyanobacteriota bacterium]|nr:hypothetical protein [Cyanobacteriota bacterium]